MHHSIIRKQKMRVTLEIDDKKMEEILKLTRQEKKAPALALALEDYLTYKRRQALVNRVRAGKTDYQASNEEIERLCAGMA